MPLAGVFVALGAILFIANFENILMPTEQQIAAQFEFARLAGQYYSIGRFAALNHCLPVAGNLLHHAVEMFLKCALSRSLTLLELKDLSHKLPKIWIKFQQVHPNNIFDEYEETILDLDRFERLRYPDNVIVEGMHASFVINTAEFVRLPKTKEPSYHLVLEEIDKLVKFIKKHTELNEIAFQASHAEEVSHYLTLHNKHLG